MLDQHNRCVVMHNLIQDYLSNYRKHFSIEKYWSIFTWHFKAFEEQKEVILTRLDLLTAFDIVENNIFNMILYAPGIMHRTCFIYHIFQHIREVNTFLVSLHRICR